MEKRIRQDILDKLSLASQEPGKRVVATLIIDGGDLGVMAITPGQYIVGGLNVANGPSEQF